MKKQSSKISCYIYVVHIVSSQCHAALKSHKKMGQMPAQCDTARTFPYVFFTFKKASGLSLQHIDKMLMAMVDLSSKNIRIKFGRKNFWCPCSGHDKNADNSKMESKYTSTN